MTSLFRPVAATAALLGAALLLPVTGMGAESPIILSTQCPPGFELDGDNRCLLRTLYQQYDSPRGAGVGGLKVALPAVRDGFTPQQIDLGRYLFFDPILSADASLSCASCHHPDKGFADGRARSIGVTGEAVGRSAPGLWNVGFMKRLFWDARASSLEEQAEGPLYSPQEMGSTPDGVLRRLTQEGDYPRLFSEAFGGDEGVTLDRLYRALAAFQSSLVSLNSRYDRYAHGYKEALNAREIEGMNVFRSFVARCAECHTPPLFSNQEIAVIGTPEPEGLSFDEGAAVPTGDPSLAGGFKVPSLRNIELTAPYMHSGRFETLFEAAEFYTKGRGHAVPEGRELYLHWHIWEPELSDRELERLVDFMKALTDERFKPDAPDRLPSGLAPVHNKNELALQAGETP
ncbi:cytochrome-c peroxidase [Aestuariirhabdus litorea]|uniref:Cytochrome-c peroxidase n=1 Tax=Aestuariirhabdus litorea TaxID=2528527 RepID=A0A3P3VLM0_9GAMM|nr:cytochrome c peroxidase [Aestuariirhabdus litorea]RRJ83652.1 cytochrome-c peroxidase [Aestuariirhabdus litorea]RWW96874.1 cytochrome-c peroxidase [Endozoicomonadaceae bacterium GTF-13]